MKKRYHFFPKNWLLCGLLTAFAFSLALNLRAQNGPAIQWDKSFGGVGYDLIYSVEQTSDGGYILAGWSDSGISSDKTQASKGSRDYWIVKLDGSGNKTWDKTFGGNDDDTFTSLRQTSDGGYILGGWSKSGISGDKSQASKGGFDYWVLKLDASGNKTWDKTFGGLDEDVLRSLQQTSDGGYILGGSSESGLSGDKSQVKKGWRDYWVVKLDASGNKLWDKSFGGNSYSTLFSLQQTPDGGYVLGGESDCIISGDKTQASRGKIDFWLVKIDASGNKLWDKTIGGSETDGIGSVQQTSDGGYILGGFSYSGISGDKTQASQSPGGNDYWVVKLDASGNKKWDKTFGGSGFDVLNSLKQTSDGGYILGGGSGSGISGDKTQSCFGYSDYWIIKLDASGNKTWDKTLNGNAEDGCTALQQTSDGGYILGGWAKSGISGDKSQASQGNADYWVLKLGPNCADLTATITPACGNGATGLNVNIDGLLPATTGTPAWTLTYTENGVSKTASGSTPTSAIVQNATPGTVYSLVSITSGSCTTNLTNSLTMPAPISQPTINQISPDTLISSGTGTSYEWKSGSTVLPITTRKLKATANGIYAVRVKDGNNCSSAFSQDYNFTVSGIKDAIETGIELFPNPTTGIIFLKLIKPQFTQVKIYNSLGECIMSKNLDLAEQQLDLDLKDRAKGIYTIQIIGERTNYFKRLILE